MVATQSILMPTWVETLSILRFLTAAELVEESSDSSLLSLGAGFDSSLRLSRLGRSLVSSMRYGK